MNILPTDWNYHHYTAPEAPEAYQHLIMMRKIVKGYKLSETLAMSFSGSSKEACESKLLAFWSVNRASKHGKKSRTKQATKKVTK